MASSRRAAPLWFAGAALLGLVWLLRFLAQTEPERAGPAEPVAVVPAAPAQTPALPEPSRAPDAGVVPLDAVVPPDVLPDGVPGRRPGEAVVALEVTLRHAQGGPAAGMGLALARGTRVLSSARTDEAGRARLEGVDGEAELYVGGALPGVHRMVLAEASGRHELGLPAGEVIEGRVTVDGHIPERRLPLALASISRDRTQGAERLSAWPVPEGEPPVPWPVRSALRLAVDGLGASRLDNAQLTGPDGSFRFSGLPAGWGAMFQVPGALRWVREADAEGGPWVVAPAAGVVLELMHAARVTGRVVAPGGERAVPGALVRWTLAGGAASASENMVADAQGRFEIPLIHDPVTRLDLLLRDPEWDASLEVVETAIDATLGADLGDLELQRVRRVAFRAVDTGRRPVEGAVAVADDGSGARSPPTDAEGRSELRGLARATRAIVVWAHRHRPTEVALPEELPEVLEVVLPAAASLDVHVVRPDGEPASNVLVEFEADEALFERPERLLPGGVSMLPEAIAFQVGTSRPSGASFRSDSASQTIVVGSMTFAPDREGLVTLSALRAGVSFSVKVKDLSGTVVWGPETLRLAEGEARTLQAVMPFASVDLEVRVRDAERRPVRDAKVSVSPAGGGSGDTDRTGADGVARFPGLYADRVQVTVEKAGYALSVLPETGLPPSGVPLDVMLLPGLDVTVSVRDTTGASVAAERVWAVLDGRTVSRGEAPAVGNALPAGALFGSQWTLTGLPVQPLTLRARVGDRIVEQWHDPRTPTAVIVVDTL